ncbi:hypothetical protein GY45DRAFT_1330603 [Cubamyces sp. BRFM 1775]|nr:hypothetical protein GY45DRAFT_1330603 [Cubamyces sp. BRFM 1775]
MDPSPPPLSADDPQSSLSTTSLYRNPALGDFIIRTSDGVQLYIYRAFLTVASPLFADMFSLPQSSSDASGADEPHVTVQEDSVVWEKLIALCYAPKVPASADLDDLASLGRFIDAGTKYQMPAAIAYVRASMLMLVAKDTLGVYALACVYKFSDVARVAARESLRLSIYHKCSDVALDLMTSHAHQRLMMYRERCGIVARSVVNKLINMNIRPANTTWPSGTRKPGLASSVAPHLVNSCQRPACYRVCNGKPDDQRNGAFMTYLETIHAQLEYNPDPDLAYSESLLKAIVTTASACPTCLERVHDKASDLSRQLRAALEETISKVKLQME